MFSLLDFFLPKRTSANDGFYPSSGGYFGYSRQTRANVRVNNFTALNYSAVWACSRAIVEPMSSIPVIGYERQGDDRKAVDIPQSVALDYPEENLAGVAWKEGVTENLVNWGNGFAEIIWLRNRRQLYLPPIHAGNITISKNPQYDYDVRNADGSTKPMLARDILHIPGIMPMGGWGRGVVNYAVESIGYAQAVDRHGAQNFGSGMHTKGVLSSKLTGEKAKNYQKEWTEAMRNPESSTLMLIDQDARYIPTQLSNEANQFLATSQDRRVEICSFWGVPPHRIGILDRATNANVEAMGIEFVIYSLFPWGRRCESAMNLKLFSQEERKRYFLEYQFNALMRGDAQARMNSYRVGICSGVLTINEVRRLENLNGIGPSGDKHYLPLNMATTEDMASGRVSMGIAGNGSDQSGAPADNPNDRAAQELALNRWLASATADQKDSAFHRWLAGQRTIERSDIVQQTKEVAAQIESRPVEWIDAARLAVQDVLTRLFTKESMAAANAAKPKGDFPAWLKEFYTKHEINMGEWLKPACAALRLAGVAKWEKSTELAAFLRARSVDALTSSYDRDSKEVFARKLAAWPSERTRMMTDEILKGAA